jgi:DNA-binding transcriptional MerR regulator
LRLHGPDEPVYTIGVVARLLGISPQTLRVFEREGLVAPSRTDANIRLYSQNELVVLRRICELVKTEGVNIAGVRAVMRVERRYGVAEFFTFGVVSAETDDASQDETETAEAETKGRTQGTSPRPSPKR